MGCMIDIDSKIQDKHKHNKNKQNRRGKTTQIDTRRCSNRVVDKILENVHLTNKKITNQQLQFAVNSFSQLAFFSTLTNQQLKILVNLLILCQIQQGEYIFRQGDIGNCFFLIQTGEVDVQIDNVKVKTLFKGQAFGQLALILRTQRTASIKAKTNCTFFIMKPLIFKQTLQKLKLKQYNIKRNSIQNVQIFQGLSNKQKLSLSNALKNIVYQKGQIIIQKDQVANLFYIIHEGRVMVQLSNGSDKDLGPNQYFGQSAFISKGKRKFTVIAAQRTVCSIISKQLFEIHSQTKAESVYYYSMKKWALQKSDIFKIYNKKTLNTINFAFQTIQAKSGTKLRNNGLVICLKGKIDKMKEGECIFGQIQWRQNSKEYPQLTQQEDGYYAYLHTNKLNQIFSNLKQKRQSKNAISKIIGSNKQNKGFIDLTSFQYLKELGEGQYGSVKLVKDKIFNRYYALKQISKGLIKKQQMQKYIQEEKKILSKIQFPFIVGFVKAFQDINNVYFLMQYIKGVELFSVIRQIKFIDINVFRYFFACLLCAVQHLHSQNIIYRDIKPENSVVDYTGKVYLIDLGTAKILKKQHSFRTFTVIGTPHYMAPQVFMNQGYSFQSDIWSLGILLYELLCGRLPFGQTEQDTYKVMAMIKKDKILYPKNLQPQAQQLLKLMLNKNSKQRSVNSSFDKIKQSQFFKGFNWQALITEKIIPPYIPKAFKDTKRNDIEKMQGQPLIKKLYPKAYQIGDHVELKQWDSNCVF